MEPSDLIARIPASKPRRGAPVLDRLLWRLKVGSDAVPPCSFDPDACWPWPGSRNGANYGRYGADLQGETYVHRGMYREVRGPIPDGYDVEHTCHSLDPTCEDGDDCPHRACSNPFHGEATTRAENHRRRRRDVLGKMCEAERHPFAPNRDGTRRCRHCYNEYMREYNRQWRAQQAAQGRTLLLRGGTPKPMPGLVPGREVAISGGVRLPSGESRYDVYVDGELAGAVTTAHRGARAQAALWVAEVGPEGQRRALGDALPTTKRAAAARVAGAWAAVQSPESA